MTSRRIGVIGSGTVAQVLAAGFKQHGHEVTIGSREPAKLAAFGSDKGIAVGTFAEAAAFGEMLVLAVNAQAAIEVLQLAGGANLAGKVVIDVNNPIIPGPPDHGVVRYFTGPNESLMERLQAAVPEARFVKAWNSVGNKYMVDPSFPGGPPTMFICGNDAAAKAEVTAILAQFGWDAADMGLVQSAPRHRAAVPALVRARPAGRLLEPRVQAAARLIRTASAHTQDGLIRIWCSCASLVLVHEHQIRVKNGCRGARESGRRRHRRTRESVRDVARSRRPAPRSRRTRGGSDGSSPARAPGRAA